MQRLQLRLLLCQVILIRFQRVRFLLLFPRVFRLDKRHSLTSEFAVAERAPGFRVRFRMRGNKVEFFRYLSDFPLQSCLLRFKVANLLLQFLDCLCLLTQRRFRIA